ncbi:MAG TPA: phosphatase PAP2 family protein [Deferrisomatales bacterium]|nr:phosphatase PAP2 family protein [Deferrisomatales bacterium]
MEATGDVLLFAIPATAYAATFFVDDAEGRGQFHKSFFLTLGVTWALKYSVNRQRPHDNGGQSFPSAHSSLAFQGASFIQRRYGWTYGGTAYLAASYVGWSRVYAHKHYPSDVLAGAAIGIASSYLFTTPFPGVAVDPIAGGGFYGLTVSRAW